MKDDATLTRDSKPPKQSRAQHLSKDKKWRTFPSTRNLLQYANTGTFFARVKVDGKLIRLSLDTNVFTTAKLLLPDFLKKHRANKRLDGAPVTFGDAQKLYEQDLEAEYAISPASKRYRGYCLKKLNASWAQLGQTKLDRILAADCKEWAGRLSQMVDAQYFNNVVGTFRLILDRGGISGADDPSRGVKRLGVKPTQVKLPEPHQFAKLLEVIETSGAGQAKHCADLVRFLAFSGCRISEARKVTWADVNLERKAIEVHSAKVRRSGNDRETRLIPIIPEMRELLERLAKAPHLPSDGVCAVADCEKSLQRASRLVGLSNVLTHHDFRHLFATRCIETGVDIPTVSRWLGHKDGGALLMRTYGHLRDGHSSAMAEKVTFSSTPANIGAKEKAPDSSGDQDSNPKPLAA